MTRLQVTMSCKFCGRASCRTYVLLVALAASLAQGLDVSTPQEFLEALGKYTDITVTQNIPLAFPDQTNNDQRAKVYTDLAPAVPAECVDPSLLSAADNEQLCNNNRLIKISAPTVISGSPDVYVDLAEIRRMVILQANITFTDLQIYGFMSDITFFFMYTNNANFICDNCTIVSPCGGQNARWLLNGIQAASPDPDAVRSSMNTDGSVARSVYADTAHSPDTVKGSASLQSFINATLLCDLNLNKAPTDADVFVDFSSGACQNKTDLGYSYRGTVSQTKSGYKCQMWSSQTPRFHLTLPSAYPKAGLVDNYCRNPDGSQPSVWCYTVDSSGPRLELCDVPFCSQGGSGGAQWGASSWRLWLVLVIVLFVVGGVLAALFVLHRRRKRAEQLVHSGEHPPTDEIGSMAERDGKEPLSEIKAAIAAIGSDDKQLLIQDVVGKGGFGVVYRGVWRGLQVAIKTVTFQDRNVSGGNAQQRAIAEAAITFSLSHPNVVATYHHDIKPLHIVPSSEGSLSVRQDSNISDWKLYLVQEFCPAGSLRKAIDSGSFMTKDRRPKLAQCVQCLLDVAQGVKYIHSKSIIHGDLNPSNVLLKQRTPAEAALLASDIKQPGATSTQSSSDAKPPSGKSSRSSSIGGWRSALRGHGPAAGSASDTQPAATDAAVEVSAVQRSDDSAMATWDLMAKVCDFGLSMKVDLDHGHVSNMRQGTPFYMSPEVHAAGQLSMAADVFAFGTMMWECYHSRPPYKMSKAKKLIRRPEFPKFPRDCPLSYAVLSISCLAADPRNRPNFWQIVGVLTDLKNYLQRVPIDNTTSCAHVTLEQLERMDGEPTVSSAQVNSTAHAPATQAPPLTQAAAALQSIMHNVSQPDIATSAVPAAANGHQSTAVAKSSDFPALLPDGSAMASMINSIADDADAGPQAAVSKVYYNAKGGDLWPIADDESDAADAATPPTAGLPPDTTVPGVAFVDATSMQKTALQPSGAVAGAPSGHVQNSIRTIEAEEALRSDHAAGPAFAARRSSRPSLVSKSSGKAFGSDPARDPSFNPSYNPSYQKAESPTMSYGEANSSFSPTSADDGMVCVPVAEEGSVCLAIPPNSTQLSSAGGAP